MPTHGYGASDSRMLGWTKDQRPLVAKIVMNHIRKICGSSPLIVTDKHPSYPMKIRKNLPWVSHMTGEELKEETGEPKPLYWINHACAMLRHDVSRLKRRALTFSQKVSCLQKHLYIHIAWTNGYRLF